VLRNLALLAAAAAVLAGCLLDIDFEGTKFSCEDGQCPAGFSCLESMCVAQSAGGDGGPGNDAGGADAAPPDGGPLLTCDEQFGEALEYTLCVEEEETCEFFLRTEVGTACVDICPVYGAECVNSFDADGAGAECTRMTEDACMVVHMTQICICTRG
jgi:hypothetical protein